MTNLGKTMQNQSSHTKDNNQVKTTLETSEGGEGLQTKETRKKQRAPCWTSRDNTHHCHANRKNIQTDSLAGNKLLIYYNPKLICGYDDNSKQH
ncbi:hypothetical protein MHYP_G00070350 [Metynnis hypsauchen]